MSAIASNQSQGGEKVPGIEITYTNAVRLDGCDSTHSRIQTAAETTTICVFDQKRDLVTIVSQVRNCTLDTFSHREGERGHIALALSIEMSTCN